MEKLAKYYQIFSVSVSQMFVFKINFVLWRFRVVIGVLMLYFLWSTVFLKDSVLFGYERSQMLSYILLVSFLRSFVLSSRSIDVAGEIREGELTNFLLRPVSYIGWWWSRDLADKAVNIGFATTEILLLYFLFRPEIVVQKDPLVLFVTITVAIASLILFFYLSFLISLSAFWIAEAWGIRFMTMIIVEFFAGGYFPLDILPAPIFKILQFTPFPYLLYFPAKVYLGQLPLAEVLTGFAILVGWIVFIILGTRSVLARGLKIYGGEGR